MISHKLANIALVEDNMVDIEYIKCILRKHKVVCNLHICRNGQEILELLYKREPFKDTEPPDLILLDLNLPRINGKQILTLIQEDQTLPPLPISILSGSDFEEDIAQCYRKGAVCYMHKPFEINLFLNFIENTDGLSAQITDDCINICRIQI